ncbi:hypothetical protein Trydic_g16638 [Trypoxylus dichotomus]
MEPNCGESSGHKSYVVGELSTQDTTTPLPLEMHLKRVSLLLVPSSPMSNLKFDECQLRSTCSNSIFVCKKTYSGLIILHRKLRFVYEPTVTNEGKASQWCRDFQTGRANLHDEQESDKMSIKIDAIVYQMDKKLRSDGRLTVTALCFLILSGPLFENLQKGLKKVVQRYEMFLEVNGNYMEKLSTELAFYIDTSIGNGRNRCH